MRDSRLTRRSINKSKHSLYISIVGIVIIIFLAFNFGPILITSLGGFIDTVTGKGNQSTKISNNEDLEAPTLDPLSTATKESTINVSGRSYYNEGEIELIVNGEKRDEFELENSQDFTFEDVELSEGQNFIKARIVINGKRSEFSEEEVISYSKDAPKLEISAPSDKQSFSKADREIIISGTTDPENTVSVNDFIAIVDSSGNFSYTYKLENGENKLTIKATNAAGQETTKELTVSYSE